MKNLSLPVSAFLFGVAYFAGAWLGDVLTFQPSYFSAFWPNSGLFIGILLLHPRRSWPFFILAAIPANIGFDLLHDRPLWQSVLFTTGNCGEALVGAWLVRRLCGPSFSLASLREMVVFVLCAGTIATTVSASFGTLALTIAFDVEPVTQWTKWWAGDMLGVLLVAPCLLLWRESACFSRRSTRQNLESALLAVSALGLSYWVLQDFVISPGKKFLLMPIAVWAALRGGVLGVALINLLCALCGIGSAVFLQSALKTPFLYSDLDSSLIQGFLAVFAGTGLLLAIVGQERKATAEELQASRKQYLRVVEGTEDLVTSTDSEGRFTFVNTICHQIFGLPPEECVGLLAFDFVHPDDRERTQRWFEDSISAGVRNQEIENRQVSRNGTEHTMLWNCAFHYDGDGRCNHVDGIAHDITEFRAAENAVRASEERHRALLQTAMDGFWMTNLEGRLLEVNETYSRMCGYSMQELIGMHISDIEANESADEISNHLREVDRQGQGRFESRHRRKDGSIFEVEVSVQRRPDTEGLFVVFIRDITERNAIDERLRQTERLSAVGQLAGGIAHDFNNQLAGVLGYAEMLANRLEDENLIRYATNIKTGAKRAADLTKQLLAFSRKGKFLSMPVEINKILAEVVSLLEHSIDKRIRLTQSLKASPAIVVGDPTQLQNSFLNIALNARDAMNEGGVLLFETDVAILDEAFCNGHPFEMLPGKYLKVSITDDGAGMDAETQSHMFEPFYTTKQQGKGTGMGLASVYGAIRNHKGAIDVYSDVGHGTTFHVYLPLSEETVASGVQPNHATIAGNARILVVDDEPMVREIATDMLRELGYKVTTCTNGREAVEYYEKSWEHIDLVLLDMVMPEIGGRDAFIAMRKINPEIRAILASGYSINGEAQTILDEGVRAFVGKPFEQAELSEKVAQVLRGDLTNRD